MNEVGHDLFAEKRDQFIKRLTPVFCSPDPIGNGVVNYFSSLLRVVGMEDAGWDPYSESKAVLDDLNSLSKLSFSPEAFRQPDRTPWRLGLLLYSHIVEMDAPYEVLVNLLRFQLGKGYSPNPFFDLLTDAEKKNYKKRGIPTARKIEVAKALSKELKLAAGDIFDDFYDNDLRNAIAHSDYILSDDEFRCRGGLSGRKGFRLTYPELDKMLLAAKAFIAAFFQVELDVRRMWGEYKQKAIPYDPILKGLIEVLVGEHDAMCGFKVHWPNGTDSVYLRTEDGIDMENCMPDLERAELILMVGRYAMKPGRFSPLVEHDAQPTYTKLQGVSVPPVWPS